MPKVGDIITIQPSQWPADHDYGGPWRIVATGDAHGEETYTAERIDAAPEHVAAGSHKWYGLFASQIETTEIETGV